MTDLELCRWAKERLLKRRMYDEATRALACEKHVEAGKPLHDADRANLNKWLFMKPKGHDIYVRMGEGKYSKEIAEDNPKVIRRRSK